MTEEQSPKRQKYAHTAADTNLPPEQDQTFQQLPGVTGSSNNISSTGKKRQRRDEYRAAAAQSKHESGNYQDGITERMSSLAAGELPKKKFYRQRAHANPFSDHQLNYPISPDHMDWSVYFPTFTETISDLSGHERHRLKQDVEVLDIGCGFGGLLFALSPLLPRTLILGLEIRTSVTEFVESKIRALRHQHQHDSGFCNVAALRANTMKFLPNFIPRHSLRHIFLCFPDPHFKQRKHKARIVSPTLASEYAYVLKPGQGIVWTVTDVEDLAKWMAEGFAHCPLFELLALGEGNDILNKAEHFVPDSGTHPGPQESFDLAGMLKVMLEDTEEGKKVSRNGGRKFVGIWKRKFDPPWPDENDASTT